MEKKIIRVLIINIRENEKLNIRLLFFPTKIFLLLFNNKSPMANKVKQKISVFDKNKIKIKNISLFL